MPGYLDHDSIMLFLDRYRDLIDEEAEELILHQENVTAYYLVNVYRRLRRNQLAEEKLLPKDIVAQVPIDMKEDNRKTFGGLDDIERLALKIVSYLDVTPRVLLERLLQRSDPEKGQGVVESLLSRRIIFPAETLLLTPRRTKVEAICIFDSFEEFVTEQMYELDTRTVIPGLLLAEARDCQDELPFALLALMDKYDSLDDQHREQVKGIVLAPKENPVALWVASYLAEKDEDLLQLADYACTSAVQVAPETLAFFGRAFSKRENHSQAIVLLERALEMKPGQPSWFHTLAHSYEKVGDLESALEHMEKAADKAPRYLDCLGVLYNKSDRDDQALECYQKAIKYDHDNAKAWTNMGWIYWKRGDVNKARECCETALEINPEFVWSLMGMAEIFLHLTDFGKVREYCLRALSVMQQGGELDAQLLNSIAYKMIMAGFLDEAVEAVEIGLERDPDYSYLYATKGLTYFRQGDVERGCELYEQAISMSPDDLALRRKFHYEHGMALRIQGKFDEAKEELECALNTASDYVLDEQVEVEIWKAERRDSSE